MNKILALVLSACILLTSFAIPANAAASDELSDVIEISFRAGDNTIMINNEPVEVETAPYIAGAGVTMVPIRVITEAFGAEMEWAYETRTITLNYGEAELVLQIDNMNIYVNGQRQTLLHAPELSAEGRTMVPLRTISENFGADVFFDDSTAPPTISVVKSISHGNEVVNIEDILRRSDMPFVGNSYFNWSIRRSPEMELGSRSNNDRRVTFSLDYADIIVNIFEDDEDEAAMPLESLIEIIQATEMTNARRFTPMGQETGQTASGTPFVSTQYRDTWDFIVRRHYILPYGGSAQVTLLIDISLNVAERVRYIELIDTFDFVFSANNTEDLSRVVDGMRQFENDDFNISLMIPADWIDASPWRITNTFTFSENFTMENADLQRASVALEIHSKPDNITVAEWAALCKNATTRTLNPSLVTVTELEQISLGVANGFFFTFEHGEGDDKIIYKDIFVERGEFWYNMYMFFRPGQEDLIARIIDGVVLNEIDPDEVEFILLDQSRFHAPVLAPRRNTTYGYSISIPVDWQNNFGGNEFSCIRTLMTISIEKIDIAETDIVQHLNDFEQRLMDDFDDEIEMGLTFEIDTDTITAPRSMNPAELADDHTGFKAEFFISMSMEYSFMGFEESYEASLYVLNYVIMSGSEMFEIVVAVQDIFYSEWNLDLVAQIIKSFTII